MAANVKPQRKFNWAWSLVTIVVAGSLIYFINLFYTLGFTEETNRQAIRISARIAVVLFSMAFGGAALHKLHQNPFTWWMRMNRRFLGISFAILHLIHLFFLGLLQQNFHPVFYEKDMLSLLVGGIAYVFVILMFLTSFPVFSKWLSPENWKRLHRVGGYWILTLFIISYVKIAMVEPGFIRILVMLGVVLIARLIVNKKSILKKE